MTLNDRQIDMCTSSTWDFSNLRALFLNCTLKRSPELSHTEGLMKISQEIMEKNGVSVEMLRPVDHDIAHGVYPDMKKQGWKSDEWPSIYEKVMGMSGPTIRKRFIIESGAQVDSDEYLAYVSLFGVKVKK